MMNDEDKCAPPSERVPRWAFPDLLMHLGSVIEPRGFPEMLLALSGGRALVTSFRVLCSFTD